MWGISHSFMIWKSKSFFFSIEMSSFSNFYNLLLRRFSLKSFQLFKIKNPQPFTSLIWTFYLNLVNCVANKKKTKAKKRSGPPKITWKKKLQSDLINYDMTWLKFRFHVDPKICTKISANLKPDPTSGLQRFRFSGRPFPSFTQKT